MTREPIEDEVLTDKPLPEPDHDDADWWDALHNKQLTVPWCRTCDRSWLRVTPTCPRCGLADWEFREAANIGSLYSWVTIHRALDPSFAGEEPYTIGLIELQGGARLYLLIAQVERELVAGEEVSIEFTTDLLPVGRLWPLEIQPGAVL